MSRSFTIGDQSVWVFTAAEADAVFEAVRRAAQGLSSPEGEGCAEFVGQLRELAAPYLDGLAASADTIDALASDVFSVPSFADLGAATAGGHSEEIELLNLWVSDPQLHAIQAYAPEGVVVPAEWRQPLEQIVAGVSAVDSGRCAVRTRWGLVGAVAVLGAAVLAGAVYIVRRR